MKQSLRQVFGRLRQASERYLIGPSGKALNSVFVAIPSREARPMANLQYLGQLFQQNGIDTYFKVYPALRPVAYCRNKIVEDFMSCGKNKDNGGGRAWEHLLMIDDDIVPPAGIWNMVLAGKDIIAAAAPAWMRGRIVSVAFDVTPEGVHEQNKEVLRQLLTVPPEQWEEKNTPVKVDAVGTGAICIHRRVFENPQVGSYNPFMTSMDDQGQEMIGEDLNFCKRARAAGFEVWADPRYVCHHFRTDMDLKETWLFSIEMFHRGINQGMKLAGINTQTGSPPPDKPQTGSPNQEEEKK